MMTGKTSAAAKPTALGSLLQASTYGMVIPTIHGTTRISPLAIWAADLRPGACNSKKGKGGGKKKKGPPQYVERIDFLLGSNPIMGFLQGWQNADKYQLTFNNLRANISFLNSYTIPDSRFYAVIAVTVEIVYSGITFTDYGAPGSVTQSGTFEYPLWNAAQPGPDLIDPSYTRYTNYKWAFGDGPVIDFTDLNSIGGLVDVPVNGASINYNGFAHIYYASLTPNFKSPAVRLCLTFESELGNNAGGEYSTPWLPQQIVYPEYAGAGSPDLDLGSSGAIPLLGLEVIGSNARFAPRGDADFCDMIEDTIKSGQIQVGAQLGLIQRGLNCNQLPGPIQKNSLQYLEPSAPNPTFRSAINAGDILVAFGRFRPQGSGVPTIADSPAANTWIPIATSDQKGFWYVNGAVASPPGDVVTLTNGGGGFPFNADFTIFDMDPGWCSAIDSIAQNSGSGSGPMTCSVTTTNGNAQPEYILVMWCDDSETAGAAPYPWSNKLLSRYTTSWSNSIYRIVYGPGTYSLSVPRAGSGNWTMVMMAFKPAQPSGLPATLGNIIDKPSLDIVRQQCLANGLWGSVNMNSQTAASDWLENFYKCADADPVWSGFVLKSRARSEVSLIGNGVVYTAVTASGPVANLLESDLIPADDGSLVVVERKAPVDRNNIDQIQFYDRNADYNPSLAGEPYSGPIAFFGPRKDSPQNLPMIQDPAVARMIMAIDVRRYNELQNTYKFKMKASRCGLEAKDLVTINDSQIGLSSFPVLLTSVQENDDYSLSCEAEPFVYGCNAPQDLPVTSWGGNTSSTGGDPGQVNAPVLFEPVPRLLAQQNQGQIWGVLSGSSANYGGCIVLLSTDGGGSYNPVATIKGNGVTGVTTADWPIATDPDTTNDLPVDLTESLGTLLSYAVSDEDNFTYPCYVAGGLTCIPYELMTYAVATLTATNKYTLKATGGGTNHLRRSVYNAPQPTTGVDHPLGSRFAFLNPLGIGIFKLNMDPTWIGKTLHFKFLAFNEFGNNIVDETTATDYTFTPTGCPSNTQNPNNSYQNTPAVSLSQTTATTVAMAQTSVQFPSNKANYNARTFTIPDPGGTPTVYYVTIADPAQLGDVGTGTALVATCQTSNALVGVPGNTYMGFIQATDPTSDPRNVAGPGGWPPPQTFIVAP